MYQIINTLWASSFFIFIKYFLFQCVAEKYTYQRTTSVEPEVIQDEPIEPESPLDETSNSSKLESLLAEIDEDEITRTEYIEPESLFSEYVGDQPLKLPNKLVISNKEQFKTIEGKLFKVDIRGERHHKKIYFKAKDLGLLFE